MSNLKLIIILVWLVFRINTGSAQKTYVYSPEEAKASSVFDTIFKKINKKEFFSIDQVDPFFEMVNGIESQYAKGLLDLTLGIWYMRKSEIDKSQRHLIEAIKTLDACCYYSKETVIARNFYVDNLTAIGLVNFDTLIFQKAYDEMTQNIEIANEIADTGLLINAYDYLGDVSYYSAFRIQNYDTALYYFDLMEALLEDYHDPSQNANNAVGKANVLRALDRPKEEQIYFDKAEKIAQENDFFGTLYALYFDKAEIYDVSGDYRKALDFKLKGYKYVLESGNKEFINRADRQLWWTYKQMGNHKKSLEHYEKYQNAIAEMKKTEVLELESELKYKDEIINQSNQITLLENKNLRSTRNFLLIVAGLIIVLLLLSLWSIRRLKKANRVLENKNREILTAQVTGQNIERKRMAGELHDNLNTKIAATRWQLEALEASTELKEQPLLTNAIAQLNDIYKDIRLIAHNLMPETVESIGLIGSIEDLISKINDSEKVKFHFVSSLSNDEKFHSLSYPVYNIIFEMLNNIMKHADAENAWISLSRNEQGDLKLSVSDDGKGFDLDEYKIGFGFKNITSRVENLHGNYNIESAPGKGTKIYIEIPQL